MSFCAICAARTDSQIREPLGRNDAMVIVCAACATQPPDAREARGGYSVRSESEILTPGEMRAGVDRMRSKVLDARQQRRVSPVSAPSGRSVTAGWIAVVVPLKIDGRSVDRREALASLARREWHGDLRWVCTTASGHVFERPGPRAAIEPYRARGRSA